MISTIVGTVYIQRSDPAQIVPAMTVFSVTSGFFVFPAIELYYTPAIKLFGYEKANGVGEAQDLVVQGFIRHVTIAFFPVVVSASSLYLLVCIKIIKNYCDHCSFSHSSYNLQNILWWPSFKF